VLLVPGEVTWLDVIVPRDAPGWSPDVHGPMVWLGRHLADIVQSLVGPAARVEVHEGAMGPTRSPVCFDGVGLGEVSLDGAKLVGMSQRRTRHAARLQCCWYTDYDPEALVALFAADHRPDPAGLAPVATLPVAIAEAVPAALRERLG